MEIILDILSLDYRVVRVILLVLGGGGIPWHHTVWEAGEVHTTILHTWVSTIIHHSPSWMFRALYSLLIKRIFCLDSGSYLNQQ